MKTTINFKWECEDLDVSSLPAEHTNYLLKKTFEQISEGTEFGNEDGDLHIPLTTVDGSTTVYGWWEAYID